jgi:sulfonate transport system substrate-binding protein
MKKDAYAFRQDRRASLGKLLGLSVSALAPVSSFAQTPAAPAGFHIGYQKGSPILIAARQQHGFETKLAKIGVDKVDWLEFQFGPPMLEAMTAGAIDIGSVGDTPPIFSQAGGGDIVYVLATPSSPHGILVPNDSPIRSLADLKGKRVAFGKGSSAHNVLLKALKLAGLSYGDIQPIYLGPSEASAAFTGRKIDAWVVWDPYYALAEERFGARVIADTAKIPELAGYAFYIANRHFVKRHPDVMHAALDVLVDTTQWADAHRNEVASLLAQNTGLDLKIQQRATQRTQFTRTAFTDEVLKSQQETADRFFEQKLIPARIDIRDIVWRG